MSDLGVDFEDLKENRFAHLLKPIRDLQDNFNVDLAHELEEYLELLENAQFAFEGARHVTVDFAEAALLIQGSAIVFSKKVEYLYNLTYQAIEAVKGRRRQLGPDGQPLEAYDAVPPTAGARGRTARTRMVDEDDEDSVERVWVSEPYLREGSDLDLAQGEASMPNAGMAIRAPSALMALEDHGQGGASGGGGKGDGDAGVYRLQQCIVHCSGALLLDPRDGDLYDHQLRFMGPQSKHDKGLKELIEAHRWEQPTQTMPPPVTQAHMPGAPGQQDAQTFVPMDHDQGTAHDYVDDDGGGYGGYGDWPSDDEAAPVAAANAGNGIDPDPATAGVPESDGNGTATAMAEYANCRPQRQQPSATQAGDGAVLESEGGGQQPEAEDVFEPYEPLDPTAKSSRLPDRPLVVRRPRKMQRKVPTKTSGSDVACDLLLPEFVYCLFFLRPTLIAPEMPEKQCAAAQEARRRMDRVTRLGPDLLAPVFDARDPGAAGDPADDAQEPVAVAQPYGFDDDDDGGGFGAGGGGASDLDDDVDLPGAGPNGFGESVGGMTEAWHGPLGVTDDMEASGRPGGRGISAGRVPPMGGLGGSEDGMALDGEEPSYEELCRAHMESMILAASAREVQSDLARRVNNWRQRIDPVLKAEESRPAFDIQDYGELIIKRLSNIKLTDDSSQKRTDQEQGLPQREGPDAVAITPVRQGIKFSQVAADLQKFEVSRLFSAMLQLINNRNVIIHKAGSVGVPPGEVPDEPLALELLSADLYHKTMGARLALPQQVGADGSQQEDGGKQQAPGKAGGTRKVASRAKRSKRAVAERLSDIDMDD
ncbi:hypothetical protein Vafri_19150 [Volvox africanus]|uniref:Condensin-2 complex subunit H2 n=1 Tax=Volvox africanus TaxID=51714 RepID=A0A8J4BNN0_9CHLO|nr:hypothetical protein Vafri_19150 [Volvox africanus]